MSEVQMRREAMLAARDRLVRDHPDHSPGAVIRCFARALVWARMDGIPQDSLIEVGEQRARTALVRRGAAGFRVATGRRPVATVAGPRVARP